MHRPTTEVFLPPMSTHLFSFSATEPQYVTTRTPNQGVLYISSQDAEPGTDRSHTIYGTTSPLAVGMARLKVLGFATLWNIPNVNPRNDVISFYSSNGVPGTRYTAPAFANRWYDIRVPADEAALVLDIVTKMNATPGAHGLVFSYTAVPGFPQTYILSAAGGTFVLDPLSPAVAKGQQMYGFSPQQVFTPQGVLIVANFSAAKAAQTMNFMYSQYIDIVSRTLSKWDKMQSQSTGDINPIIIRAYAGGQAWGLQFQDISAHPVEMSWKADEPLTYFDIRMFDQNGDPLYVPNGGKDFIWQLTLAAAI